MADLEKQFALVWAALQRDVEGRAIRALRLRRPADKISKWKLEATTRDGLGFAAWFFGDDLAAALAPVLLLYSLREHLRTNGRW